uniref:Cholesteryl ester transfer protein n=1 Tax=Gasterosteus aculeatus aculeatus TaxID=481459 RepID=A0AAQ4Q792_GASAC
MPRDVFPPPRILLLFLSVIGASNACLQDPASAYRLTGAVCRLTYPAAVVLNEKTTKVIEAAFQHARYPGVKGQKSLPFIGKVTYELRVRGVLKPASILCPSSPPSLEIHNLSIGQSAVELLPGEGIALDISNVSAVFRGNIQYGYGSWLVNVAHSIDFEIESQIDLGIKPKLYCGEGKVAADTRDCYLNFHKLHLHLQGNKEPNWLRKLFTDFITFTVKLAIKGQICKEINKVANILADFIQDRADQFLSYGDIGVDIGITTAPVINANYVESYHKGLTKYNNTSAVISDSVFHPSQLTEDKMLYFWISDQVFNPMVTAAHQDGLLQLNISGAELTVSYCVLHSGIDQIAFQGCGGRICNGCMLLTWCLVPALEIEITRLLDKQGTNLFDIFNPEVLPQDGFVVIQMDFGFPHHLLTEFLRKTLQ